jgi:hypothetical protein
LTTSTYAISLLSGHLGGANALAQKNRRDPGSAAGYYDSLGRQKALKRSDLFAQRITCVLRI